MIVLEFALTPSAPPFERRIPGEALAALPTAPLLLRQVERTPPEIEIVERILNALREW